MEWLPYGEGVEEARLSPTPQMAEKDPIITLVRELVLAGGMIGIIVLGMWAHTGSMPPLVVVESKSMMHDSEGQLGAIDAGDLVLVHSPESKTIISYAEATDPNNANYGYENHGTAGDVIIYNRNGETDSTPIIHRVIISILAERTSVTNTNGTCDEGVLYEGQCILSWTVPGTDQYDVESITFSFDGNGTGMYSCGENWLNTSEKIPRHPGFITLGDNNNCSDDQAFFQPYGGVMSGHSGMIQPIKSEWVIGIAGAEIPWLGVVKLFVSGDDSPGVSQVPGSSFFFLILAIGGILAAPVVLEPVARKLLVGSPEMLEAEREDAMAVLVSVLGEEE